MNRYFLATLFLLSVLVLTGCSAKKLPRIFWPPPPGDSALEFVGLYYSDADFDKSGMETFLAKFLGSSSGEEFQRPVGIASDGRGRVYVADQILKNVRVFDFNKRHMHMLTKEPVFAQPAGLAIDSQKRLYVVDAGARKIAVYSPDDQFLFSFGSSEHWQNPAYLAINERLGRIYVSDGRASKIFVFDLQGKPLFSFGQPGDAPGSFNSPQGLAIDGDNRVFVADQYNARVQVFAADGTYLRHFGERGDGAGQMEMPKDLAFDSAGHLYLVDTRRASLTVYTPDGEPFLYLGGVKGSQPLAFGNPAFIHIDSADRIHVSDMINQRFVIWQYLSSAYLRAHPITAEDVQALETVKMKQPEGATGPNGGK